MGGSYTTTYVKYAKTSYKNKPSVGHVVRNAVLLPNEILLLEVRVKPEQLVRLRPSPSMYQRGHRTSARDGIFGLLRQPQAWTRRQTAVGFFLKWTHAPSRGDGVEGLRGCLGNSITLVVEGVICGEQNSQNQRRCANIGEYASFWVHRGLRLPGVKTMPRLKAMRQVKLTAHKLREIEAVILLSMSICSICRHRTKPQTILQKRSVDFRAPEILRIYPR